MVTISPEVTSTKRRDIMENVTNIIAQYHRYLVYDGKNSAFAAGPLPKECMEFSFITEQTEFKICLKVLNIMDLDILRQFLLGRQQYHPQETIEALDIVLRVSASKGREIIGRSLFSPEMGRGPLGDGIEFWKGFYQSLKPTQMGLSLNIDMSARAFYEKKLVSDFVAQFLGQDISKPLSALDRIKVLTGQDISIPLSDLDRIKVIAGQDISIPLSDRDRIKVERALRGVCVEVRHKDYTSRYKVKAVTVQPTSLLHFVDETGTTKTVVQYFRERYNIHLEFPSLPAIQAGNDAKPIYLPMEICRIAKGQRCGLKLIGKQVTQFLRATCVRPQLREKSIIDTMKSNNYNNDKLVSDEFGMHVSQLLPSINARVLPPPPLSYSGRIAEVNPSVGQWNMTDLKMINGGTVDYWTIINFSRENELAVGRFFHGLVSMCQTKGMVFNPRPLIRMSHASPHRIEKALEDLKSRCTAQLVKSAPGRQLDMLFIILPEAEGAYPTIKRVCETKLGIVSQCCKPHHVMKMSNEYFVNVALKINVKVGGRNTVLAGALNGMLPYVTDRPTIIFGAYVTHPHTGDDSRPFLASVVASMDWPQVTNYKALVSVQPCHDIIHDLYTISSDPNGCIIHGGSIRELLISYKRSTGLKPHRIIFYRDGVYDSEINDTLLTEVEYIRMACRSLEEDYLPRLTFLVVQKSHRTRFFPVKHGDMGSTDSSGNVLPGTVVDTQICHPTQFDFYLCSHAGIQGTSRPTRYLVLFDENECTADGLQMLTNSLCYTYQRCTRSVSIVPPAYYARLAASRARSYIEGDLSDSDSLDRKKNVGLAATRDSYSLEHRKNVNVRHLPVIHENVKSVMYYL